MIRLLAMSTRTLSLWLMLAALSPAQEAPPLEPPSLDPPATGAATNRETPPPPPRPVVAPTSRPRPENRPMLAIPGVTAPASRPTTEARTPAAAKPPALLPMPLDFPSSRSDSSPAGFPLAGPTTSDKVDEASPRLVRPNAGRPSSVPTRSRSAVNSPPIGETIPLTIDPLDDEPSGARGSSSRSPASRLNNDRPVREEGDRIEPRPMPRRSPGLFGRLFGPPPTSPVPPPPRESTRTAEKPKPDRESSIDSTTDPDLVNRRKIERQIASTLGDRVRSVEVFVTGRNVEIRARASRFWYRRSVRRSLETLPAIQGYRSRIEVTD